MTIASLTAATAAPAPKGAASPVQTATVSPDAQTTAIAAEAPVASNLELVISAARQSAAARQDGLSLLMANLLRATAAGNLPVPVQQAVDQLIALHLPTDVAPDAATMKTALVTSGLFTEATLAAPGSVPVDIKTALLQLNNAAEGWLARTVSTATSVPQSATPPVPAIPMQPAIRAGQGVPLAPSQTAAREPARKSSARTSEIFGGKPAASSSAQRSAPGKNQSPVETTVPAEPADAAPDAETIKSAIRILGEITQATKVTPELPKEIKAVLTLVNKAIALSPPLPEEQQTAIPPPAAAPLPRKAAEQRFVSNSSTAEMGTPKPAAPTPTAAADAAKPAVLTLPAETGTPKPSVPAPIAESAAPNPPVPTLTAEIGAPKSSVPTVDIGTPKPTTTAQSATPLSRTTPSQSFVPSPVEQLLALQLRGTTDTVTTKVPVPLPGSPAGPVDPKIVATPQAANSTVVRSTEAPSPSAPSTTTPPTNALRAPGITNEILLTVFSKAAEALLPRAAEPASGVPTQQPSPVGPEIAAAISTLSNAGLIPAAPSSGVDLKTLLALFNRLAENWLPRTSAPEANVPVARTPSVPPPLRGAPSKAQPAALASLPEGADATATAKQLLTGSDAALARHTLLQIASLPDAAPQSRPSDTRWVFDVPLITPQGAAVAQMIIERDGSGISVEKPTPVWRVQFAIDVEPLGPVRASLALCGDRTWVTISADRPESLDKLQSGVSWLADALQATELNAEIAFQPGRTPHRNGTTSRFVDHAS